MFTGSFSSYLSVARSIPPAASAVPITVNRNTVLPLPPNKQVIPYPRRTSLCFYGDA